MADFFVSSAGVMCFPLKEFGVLGAKAHSTSPTYARAEALAPKERKQFKITSGLNALLRKEGEKSLS